MFTSPELKTRPMLWKSWLPGVVTGGYAAIAELSCDATTTDQYSGKNDRIATSEQEEVGERPGRLEAAVVAGGAWRGAAGGLRSRDRGHRYDSADLILRMSR